MPAFCILCHSKAVINQQDYAGRTIYNCPLCGMFVISDLVEKQVRAHSHKIASFMMARKLREINDVIFISFDQNNVEKGYVQLTVGQILEFYPEAFSDKMEAALENLSRLSPHIGDEVVIDRVEQAPLFYVGQAGVGAILFMLGALRDAGWIRSAEHTPAGFSVGVTVTGKGWRRLDEMKAGKGAADIALVSSPEIGQGGEYWNSVQKACRTTGYQVVANSHAEEEPAISPFLIARVKSSKIVVCEISEALPEAYFVAGMARALGKLCVLTCREKSRKSLPVDYEQIGVLFWETPEQLSQKLVFAIQALR